jgi:hypothetical protein
MRPKLHLQPIFLVERYLPALTDDQAIALATRLETATRALQTSDTHAVWLGSTALLPEETTFCAFDGHSEDDVRALNEFASAPYERVVKALIIKPRSPTKLP